ncbi:MAG: ABC transporter permease [Defluviitaleaceae bacterium]|nr:ABC transporter permease [Defluviitaleaceae bacterium]
MAEYAETKGYGKIRISDKRSESKSEVDQEINQEINQIETFDHEFLEGAESTEKVPSLAETIWKEIWNTKAAMVALVVFALILVFAFATGFFFDETEALRVNIRTTDRAPEWFAGEFFLGTDPMGRDMVQQLMLSARNSFAIALIVTIGSMIIGIIYGLISGYYGGHIDNTMMRILEFLLLIPGLMLIIVIVSITPNYQTWHFIMFLTLLSWMGRARLIRAKVMQQVGLDYVSASKTLGTRNFIIMVKKVLPNITSIIVVDGTISVASNMGIETGLTILGFGLPFGTPSLGNLIRYAAANPIVLTNRLWQWMPATVLIFVMSLCVYFVGSTISRAVDPKQQRT